MKPMEAVTHQPRAGMMICFSRTPFIITVTTIATTAATPTKRSGMGGISVRIQL
jgi:hypothetical protein